MPPEASYCGGHPLAWAGHHWFPWLQLMRMNGPRYSTCRPYVQCIVHKHTGTPTPYSRRHIQAHSHPMYTHRHTHTHSYSHTQLTNGLLTVRACKRTCIKINNKVKLRQIIKIHMCPCEKRHTLMYRASFNDSGAQCWIREQRSTTKGA